MEEQRSSLCGSLKGEREREPANYITAAEQSLRQRDGASKTGITVEGRVGAREDGTAAVCASSLLARLLKVITERLTRDSLHPSVYHPSFHNLTNRVKSKGDRTSNNS